MACGSLRDISLTTALPPTGTDPKQPKNLLLMQHFFSHNFWHAKLICDVNPAVSAGEAGSAKVSAAWREARKILL